MILCTYSIQLTKSAKGQNHMKKIGLDIHGVISNNPDLFKELTNTWCQAGIEVHIITGSRISDSLKNQLREWGIQYTHLFSISDYHHGLGTPMQGYEKYQPLLDENLWNRTKGEYCQKMGIDLHIDDTEIYGDYFTTPFMLYDSEDNKFVIQHDDMTPPNFRVSSDVNQSCMKCAFVRRIQGSLVCTAYYDFKIPNEYHVCDKR